MRYRGAVASVGLLLASLACGDSGGPELHGPVRFSGTLDGASWSPDTAVGIVFAAECDTTTILSGVRQVSINQVDEVSIILHRFPAAGQFTLGDSSAAAFGAYFVTTDTGGLPPSIVAYYSLAASPGSLTITGTTQDDSLVSGSYAFEAAMTPDTAPHRHLTGQFRVRYSVQPVYNTPPGCGP